MHDLHREIRRTIRFYVCLGGTIVSLVKLDLQRFNGLDEALRPKISFGLPKIVQHGPVGDLMARSTLLHSSSQISCYAIFTYPSLSCLLAIDFRATHTRIKKAAHPILYCFFFSSLFRNHRRFYSTTQACHETHESSLLSLFSFVNCLSIWSWAHSILRTIGRI